MNKSGGLWLAVTDRLELAIRRAISSRGEFSVPAPREIVRSVRLEMLIVSLGDQAPEYLAIGQAGRKILTGQVTFVVSNLIPINDPPPIDALRKRLSPRLRSHFDPPAIGIKRLSAKVWKELLQLLTPDNMADRVREFQSASSGSIGNYPSESSGGEIEAFERDAVASAIEAWGGTKIRKRILRSAGPSSGQAPFLSRLSHAPLREDPGIIHDQLSFPGMELAERSALGIVVLTNGVERLTIINCNRQPLEHTLGVDLIYYSHQFQSFVLVQYKRMMSSKNGSPFYRPSADANHGTELVKMIQADRLLKSIPAGSADVASYRLFKRPFFLKLCYPKTRSAFDPGMLSGMYIPLGLWRRLLKCAAVRGRRGGIKITWENCPRRLSTSQFTTLLRYGWIGSSAGQTDKLSGIIESVLSSGRMLVLAATSPRGGSRDYCRDTLGRFAEEDGVVGTF